ncbi:3-isopropylmalate dehydratase large subunit [Hydrogenophaga sp. BPS33]|uniref:3-isopropylmalate dehydratase large subunit n=1 Tax=Hydrogenophaga sp. BPS33 TaxID=2651974 RepID=UPI00135C066C|nr:aconitase family protein [Hydrogenophaga sp. BPS33]
MSTRIAQTATEKILARASGLRHVRAGEVVSPQPDLVILHDGYIETAHRELSALGYASIVRPERVMFVTDHEVAYASPKAALRGKKIRDIARAWGVGQFFDVGRGGHGHLFPLERGFVQPGMYLSCYDMHCTTFGAVGALATAPGPEITTVLACGTLWEQVPATVRVELRGTPGPAVSARDIGFHITTLFARGELPAQHDNRVIEFCGDFADRLPRSERVALCNSLTEIGVANVLFHPIDGGAPVGAADWRSDADAAFESVISLDISALGPQVALPGGPHHGVDIDSVTGQHVDHTYIGSCGSGMYEDFVAAASVLHGRRIAEHVRLFIVPGTVDTAQRLVTEGLQSTFLAAGAVVLPPGCGPCAGGIMGPMADGEVSISTAATNHSGRFGSRTSQAYLASPWTVAASAVQGRITDPRTLLPNTTQHP